MNCRHCQHWNPEDEQRCRLCGRKLHSSGNETTSEWALNVVSGNLAAAPERSPVRRPAPEQNRFSQAVSPQRTLFPDRPSSKIIPFESRGVVTGSSGAAAAPALAPVMPGPAPSKPATPRKPATAKAAVSPRKNDRQRELDLLPPAPIAPRTLKTKVEASIYCDAPVATLTHRLLAGVIDFSLILFGYLLCVSSYFVMGGGLPVHRLGWTMFGVAFVLIAMFYGVLWVLGNGETPGMQWTRLSLTNFDGQELERSQRLARYLGTCLSVATCGCGLLWALVDEENLTWQDHISKTFPTFQRPDTNLCQAR